MQTLAGGGEAGINTGFGFFVLFTYLPHVSALQRILSNGWNGAAGCIVDLLPSGVINCQMADGGSTGRACNTPPMQPSDAGRLQLLCFLYDGTLLDSELARAELVRTFAMTGYTPTNASRRFLLGGDGTNAFQSAIVACMAFRGTPTLAQRKDYADATRALGDLPPTFTGATVTHRWSLRDELRGTTIVNGQTGPAQLTDRATLASVDALARNGTPTVKIIDPSIEGRRTLGAQGYSSANYLACAIGAGIRSSAAGFFVALGLRLDSVPVGAQALASLCNTAGAYEWQFNVVGTLLRYFIQDGSGGKAAASYTITTADVGIPLLFIGNYTGSGVQFFVCRQGVAPVATGVDTAATGVTVSTTDPEMRIGGIKGLTQPFTAGSVFAVSGGQALTLSDVTDLYNAWSTTLRLPATAKTQHLWELSTDILASGVDAVPTTVLDRVGTDTLTALGGAPTAGGLTLAQRTDRLWSYEKSPVIYGAQAFSSANYYEVSGGFPGAITGMFVALLYVVRSQGVASATRVGLSKRPDTAEGWQVATAGTNSTIGMTLSTTTSTYATPASVIAANDVGKLMLFTGVLDVPALKLRGYIKRNEISTGTTFAGTFLPSAVAMMLGRRGVDFLPADAGIDVYGFTCGNAIPTLAEIQALHDACMAAEDIQEIPGRSAMTVSLKRDVLANAGALPATLLDRTGSQNMSRIGAGPTIAPEYSRAWGW
jgi:hypothetical protein